VGKEVMVHWTAMGELVDWWDRQRCRQISSGPADRGAKVR